MKLFENCNIHKEEELVRNGRFCFWILHVHVVNPTFLIMSTRLNQTIKINKSKVKSK